MDQEHLWRPIAGVLTAEFPAFGEIFDTVLPLNSRPTDSRLLILQAIIASFMSVAAPAQSLVKLCIVFLTEWVERIDRIGFVLGCQVGVCGGVVLLQCLESTSLGWDVSSLSSSQWSSRKWSSSQGWRC